MVWGTIATDAEQVSRREITRDFVVRPTPTRHHHGIEQADENVAPAGEGRWRENDVARGKGERTVSHGMRDKRRELI
jgi:hypothetical protein